MALEFARSNVLSRSAGHTAVKAAAYRSGQRLADTRIGKIVDYSHRAADVGHSEVLLPVGADPSMADRTTLWCAVEDREDQHNRRASARLAVDHVIALPIEFTHKQHIDIARQFAQREFVSRGLVVDLAIHYHSKGNPHAHLMTTTRPLVGRTFGLKDREVDGKFYAGQKLVDAEQLRHRWADFQNQYFIEKGIDAHVCNNDGEFKAEVHLGPTHAMEEKGTVTVRQQQQIEAISAREQALLAHPEIVIERVSERKSVFTKHDLYRELHTLVNNPLVFANVKLALDAHGSLIGFEVQGKDYFTTQKVLETEMDIRAGAEVLSKASRHHELSETHLTAALEKAESLSDEQRYAVLHLAQNRRLGVVVGLAGAGKSTMLATYRHVCEAQGHRVQGIALAGKAADELEKSAGIESRTISSWLLALAQDRITLEAGDVVIMDEAGMTNNKTMLAVISQVEQADAKLILVGDGEQLQPIEAGCPFRDIAQQQGFAEIGTIRRQRTEWQRTATRHLAEGRGGLALQAYTRHGHVHDFATALAAKTALVADYVANGLASKIVLAHRNIDVRDINDQVQQARVASGEVGTPQPFRSRENGKPGSTPLDLRPGDEIILTVDHPRLGIKAGDFGTYLSHASGEHHIRQQNGREVCLSADTYGAIVHRHSVENPTPYLGVGDRVLFTRNDTRLGVKNGTLGTVTTFQDGQLSVALDDGKGQVQFSHDDYPQVALGYATTIHKAQGLTVDRAYLMASSTLDKHLGYVGMSRHRESLDVFVASDSLRGQSLSSKLEQTHRQETVVDLAERHGVEVDPSDPASFQLTPVPDLPEVMMDAQSDASRVDLAQVMDTSPSNAITIETARRTLEREIEKRLQLFEQRHTEAMEPIQAKEVAARSALDQHLSNKPRETGFFVSKPAIEAWRESKRELEILHGNAQRAVFRAQESFRASRGERHYIAEQQINAAFPDLAHIVETAKAKDLAGQLLDRWQTLEKRLAEFDRSGSTNQARLDVQRSLEKVLDQLMKSTSIANELPRERQNSLKVAHARNAQQIQKAQALSRNRGLSL